MFTKRKHNQTTPGTPLFKRKCAGFQDSRNLCMCHNITADQPIKVMPSRFLLPCVPFSSFFSLYFSFCALRSGLWPLGGGLCYVPCATLGSGLWCVFGCTGILLAPGTLHDMHAVCHVLLWALVSGVVGCTLSYLLRALTTTCCGVCAVYYIHHLYYLCYIHYLYYIHFL
jgi:hypothetical protein